MKRTRKHLNATKQWEFMWNKDTEICSSASNIYSLKTEQKSFKIDIVLERQINYQEVKQR